MNPVHMLPACGLFSQAALSGISCGKSVRSCRVRRSLFSSRVPALQLIAIRCTCMFDLLAFTASFKCYRKLTPLVLQGKYILTPCPITCAEEQLLNFFGQLLGIAIRADVPLPLDLLGSFWKGLVGEALDPESDFREADLLTYNYIKKFENVNFHLYYIMYSLHIPEAKCDYCLSLEGV